MRRVLILSTTTGYQLRSFGEAAARAGIELIFATDRCHRLDDPWRDAAVPGPVSRAGRVGCARSSTRRGSGRSTGSLRSAIGTVGTCRPRRRRAGAQRQSSGRGRSQHEQEARARAVRRGGSAGAVVESTCPRGSPDDPRESQLPLRRQAARAVGQPRRDSRGHARTTRDARSSRVQKLLARTRRAGGAHGDGGWPHRSRDSSRGASSRSKGC